MMDHEDWGDEGGHEDRSTPVPFEPAGSDDDAEALAIYLAAVGASGAEPLEWLRAVVSERDRFARVFTRDAVLRLDAEAETKRLRAWLGRIAEKQHRCEIFEPTECERCAAVAALKGDPAL